MEKIKQLLGLIYKNIFIVLLVATISVVLSVGYIAIYTTPTYSATAKVLVHNGNLNEINTPDNANTNISAIDTCLEIFNSPDIFAYLKSNVFADLSYTAAEINQMVKVSAKGEDSLIFYITSTCDIPEVALRITREYSNMMYPYISKFVNHASVNILSLDATATQKTPDLTITIILSLITGTLLGSVCAVFFSLTNRRLSGADDFKSRYSVKLLGVVPDFENEGGNNNAD